MSNSNMINPANYYNPFARYNYISRTRGAYVPQNAGLYSDFSKLSTQTSEKSPSIFSDNYDANADILKSMESVDMDKAGEGGFLKEIFNNIFKK